MFPNQTLREKKNLGSESSRVPQRLESRVNISRNAHTSAQKVRYEDVERFVDILGQMRAKWVKIGAQVS